MPQFPDASWKKVDTGQLCHRSYCINTQAMRFHVYYLYFAPILHIDFFPWWIGLTSPFSGNRWRLIRFRNGINNFVCTDHIRYPCKGKERIKGTCKGVLAADKDVKPTISLKKIVTISNVSGSTAFPRLSWSATDLSRFNKNNNFKKRWRFSISDWSISFGLIYQQKVLHSLG